MRILFAFLPLPVRYNHGIALLSALCKQRGIETGLCVLGDEGDFIKALIKCDVVGFSCVTVHDYRACIPFMRIAKAMGRLVLLGGVWAGLGHPVDPCVDLVCRGDGERLPDFLLHGRDEMFTRPEVWMDLNALPLPDYGLFSGIPFERGLTCLEGKSVLPYYSSRGCNGACSFCQVRHQPKGVRVRSRIEEDLRFLADECRPDLFFMGDACLPFFHRAWKDSWGDFAHPFFAYIRADIRPHDLDWLISRGMKACAFGVESGDERHRNQVLRKGLTDQDLWRTVGHLEARGVDMVTFFMVGTPGETAEIQKQTWDMAAKLPSIVFHYEALV